LAYSIRLPLFEGPLDLLLHLIRSRKLDIRDIPIAAVTRQYLEYLELMEALDLDVAGEFLVMAATLMEIKSRMLLPRPDPPLAEDEGQDPRAELVARLLEYERFQQVAEQLRELAAETQRAFPRTAVEQWEGSTPLVELRPQDLLAALRRISGEETEEEKVRAAPLRLRRQAINLKQRMADILRRTLAHDGPLPFSALVTFAGRRLARREILVTFLAILELVRLGQIRAYQHAVRGDIFLVARREDEGAPTE
jgi:segregation and condensation protein A